MSDYGVEIHLDDLSQKEILSFIDKVNFNTKRFIAQDYKNFKKYISASNYPRHVDYLNNDYAPDLIKFMQSKIDSRKSASYYGFLKAIGEEDLPAFNERQEQFIKYVSEKLPIVRPYEYLIIQKLIFSAGKEKLSKISHYVEISASGYEQAAFEHALHYMLATDFFVLDGDELQMLDYINSIKYARELIKDKDGNYVEGDKLFIGKQLELQVGWVFYVNYELPVQPWTKSSNTVRVNFFNKFWIVKDAEQFFANNYFIKDLPWEYEKEFRLVFINKTDKRIEKIKIEIPEILRNNDKKTVKVKLAPEISNSVVKESDGDGFKNCSDRLDEMAKKNRYQLNVSKSELKINMNLLERSKDYINDYILSHPEFIPEETAKKVEEHYQSVRDAKKNT